MKLLSYTIQTSCFEFLNSQTIQMERDVASSHFTAAFLQSAISSGAKAVTD